MTIYRFSQGMTSAVVSLVCAVMLITALTSGGISAFPLRFVAGVGGKGSHAGVFLRDQSPGIFYTLCAAYLILALISLLYAANQFGVARHPHRNESKAPNKAPEPTA